VISHQIYAIQHLKVNLVIMQVLWDKKIEYAGGEVHLPFSKKNYSYVLPLLLFDTLDLQDF
jgi:hypothetical protein